MTKMSSAMGVHLGHVVVMTRLPEVEEEKWDLTRQRLLVRLLFFATKRLLFVLLVRAAAGDPPRLLSQEEEILVVVGIGHTCPALPMDLRYPTMTRDDLVNQLE